jgi:hypothetical protein
MTISEKDVKEGGKEQTKKLCALLSPFFGLGSQIMSVIILIIIPFPIQKGAATENIYVEF